MKIAKYLLMSLFVLCHVAMASDLSSLLGAVHTMRADFVQTIYDNRGKAIQQSFGNMALQRPGKFRWEIRKPIPQVIIANDTRLWIYDPDLDQVTVRALHQAAGESPALLLSHENATIDKDYSVTPILKGHSATSTWFLLKPRAADSVFDSVSMGFVNGELREMQLQDHLGHTTKIQFQHAKMNESLPASLFVFKKPAKVDVIDETKR